MSWKYLAVTALLVTGSIGQVNSPGAAADPIPYDDASKEAYIDVIEEMHDRWQAMDSTCDPDQIFGLLYLITTAKVGDLVQANHFEDNPFLVEWDADFAGRYFAAYDAYHHGDGLTPVPWQMAFEHADSGTSTVTEDLLLGMNAHVNYDLAYSAYEMGLPNMDGGKAEYDRVNDAFWNVVVPIGNEMGARYDPGQARQSQEVEESDYGTIELLISWRENAWENAVNLAGAQGNPIAFAAAEQKILSESVAIAQGLTNDNGDTATERVAYCQASGHPPLDAANGGSGYWGRTYGEENEEPSDPHEEGETMVICHKPDHKKGGQTKTIPRSAWKGHEGHGDTKGPCPEDSSPDEDDGKGKKKDKKDSRND